MDCGRKWKKGSSGLLECAPSFREASLLNDMQRHWRWFAQISCGVQSSSAGWTTLTFHRRARVLPKIIFERHFTILLESWPGIVLESPANYGPLPHSGRQFGIVHHLARQLELDLEGGTSHFDLNAHFDFSAQSQCHPVVPGHWFGSISYPQSQGPVGLELPSTYFFPS